MYTESNVEVPKWAQDLIKGLVSINTRLIERQNALEARFESKSTEKPEEAETAAATPAELDKLMERLR